MTAGSMTYRPEWEEIYEGHWCRSMGGYALTVQNYGSADDPAWFPGVRHNEQGAFELRPLRSFKTRKAAQRRAEREVPQFLRDALGKHP